KVAGAVADLPVPTSSIDAPAGASMTRVPEDDAAAGVPVSESPVSGVAGAAVAAPPSMAIAATVGSLLSCQKSRPPAATRSTAATASQGAPLDTRGTSSSRSSSPNFGTAGDARTVPAAALTGTLAGAGPSRSLTASRGAPIPGSTMTAGM